MSNLRRSLIRRMHGVMFKLPLMITCEEFENFILAYFEDELSPKQKTVFELHLKVCRECRDYMKAYATTLELTRQSVNADSLASLEKVPDDLVEAILAARNS